MNIASIYNTVRPRQGANHIEGILAELGSELGGAGPVDVQIHDNRVHTLGLANGTKGLLDAYVDGWWDCERLDELVCRYFTTDLRLSPGAKVDIAARALFHKLFNAQSIRRSTHIRRHYDLGNDLFETMLDPLMIYSCGYWKQAADLTEAQEHKLDLVCRKLDLKPGMRVVDIGCGWGGFAKFAAERYGVSVVGVTLSHAQLELGRERCAGLPIELRLQDYRELPGETFDAVVSIGMFEHVGYKNYPTMMKVIREVLVDDGLCLLHTIGSNTSRQSYDPWMNDNVFPNAMLPSVAQIGEACEGRLVIEDLHNFGPDYDRTLMAWNERFEAGWSELRGAKYDDRFRRMWRCFLLVCAGLFRAREQQLWQLVLSPQGVRGGYTSVR